MGFEVRPDNLKPWFVDPDGFVSKFKDKDSNERYKVYVEDFAPDALDDTVTLGDATVEVDGDITALIAGPIIDKYMLLTVKGTSGTAKITLPDTANPPRIWIIRLKFYPKEM